MNESALNKVIEALNQERAQEAVAQPDGSFLQGIDTEKLLRREKEYKDPEKQLIRRQWVKVGETLRQQLKRPLRYLTLPAYHRMDVTMMHKAGLFKVAEKDGRQTISVAAFETDPSKFSRMTGTIPAFEFLGNSSLEDAITDSQNPYFDDLLSMFPFDIVNFDLTTSLTPKHEGPYSRIMRALDEVLKRQALPREDWALFLTFRNVEDEWEANALKQFIDNLQENLDDYPACRDKFSQLFSVSSALELKINNPRLAIIQSVAKWLVDRAHVQGMRCIFLDSYEYSRYPTGKPSYMISKLMMRFGPGVQTKIEIPMKRPVRETWMEEDLVDCISKNKHKSVEELLLRNSDLITDLEREVSALINEFEKDYQQLEPSQKIA